jgi:hypothetical protein
VIVLAIVSSYFALPRLIGFWAPSGDFSGGFGIVTDPATALVSYVDLRIASTGIRVGDLVDLAALSFSDREYLYEDVSPAPGVSITLKTKRAGSLPRITTLKTVPGDYGNDDITSAFGEEFVAVAYILVAIGLVWSRPNIMLWGLAVFLIRTHTFQLYCGNLRSPTVAAIVMFGWVFVHSIGWPGLIVFAARFPDNRTNAATKYWDIIAVAFFLVYMFLNTYPIVPMFTARPIPDYPDWMFWAFSTSAAFLILFALCWKVARTKIRSQWRGFRWVVAGYGISIPLGWIGANLLFQWVPMPSNWPEAGREVLMLALPASVAYAIIRHRAFDFGYLTNRTIVYGSLVFGAVSPIVISVWAASRLTSSVGIGIAMFVALLAGMTLRSSRTSVVRFVDRVFLRRRYEAAVSLDALRDTLRGSNDARRLTDEVATTLGLSSLAVFSRAADGGFVRNAAFGWPPGSAWHLLPDETLTRTLDDGDSAIVRVPDDQDDLALPVAEARPRFALAVRRGDRVERASLDRDAMRSLHGVFDEAIFA